MSLFWNLARRPQTAPRLPFLIVSLDSPSTSRKRVMVVASVAASVRWKQASELVDRVARLGAQISKATSYLFLTDCFGQLN